MTNSLEPSGRQQRLQRLTPNNLHNYNSPKKKLSSSIWTNEMDLELKAIGVCVCIDARIIINVWLLSCCSSLYE
jgi:hypothetical protein